MRHTRGNIPPWKDQKRLQRLAHQHRLRRAGLTITQADRDEPRSWWLGCSNCGHRGSVHIAIEELRDAMIAGKVRCSQCGAIRTMHRVNYGST